MNAVRRALELEAQDAGELMYCSITVSGHLDRRWTDWFDGLTITHLENGKTVLAGHVPDQAALHGALSRVRDLGLPLVDVRCDGG